MDKKISTNEVLYKLYQNIKFRQYKWYSFINKKRTEDNMLNKIEKTYTKENIVIIGDWSIGKQMKNFISTPNLSLKRKLQERFRVYDIDEYRTSCLNYKTEELCNIAVSICGASLKYVPDEYKTYNICISAIMQDGLALEYVPNYHRNRELCNRAYFQNIDAVAFFPQNF